MCCVQGTSDPVQVTQRILSFLAQHNASSAHPSSEQKNMMGNQPTDVTPSMRLAWFSMWGEGTLDAAVASKERWSRQKPLSVLDGVPYAVKDSQDAAEYPTMSGTTFMHRRCAALHWHDAGCARLFCGNSW
jgi:Asp-tRNA(Asn)/Glu-tRNA(Gln) amidotransferase A subunit family amidase